MSEMPLTPSAEDEPTSPQQSDSENADDSHPPSPGPSPYRIPETEPFQALENQADALLQRNARSDHKRSGSPSFHDIEHDEIALQQLLEDSERAILADARSTAYQREQASTNMAWEHNQLYDFVSQLQELDNEAYNDVQSRYNNIAKKLRQEKTRSAELTKERDELLGQLRALKEKHRAAATSPRAMPWQLHRSRSLPPVPETEEPASTHSALASDGHADADAADEAAPLKPSSVAEPPPASRKPYLIAAAAALLVLVIMLFVMLLTRPADAPEFVGNPSASIESGLGFDVRAVTDSRGSLHYVVLSQGDFDALRETLPTLRASDVYYTSQGWTQTPFSEVASACGSVVQPEADLEIVFTVRSVDANNTECQRLRAGQGYSTMQGWGPRQRCLRCPEVDSEQNYVVLLVADNGPYGLLGRLSDIAVVPVRTSDVSPPQWTLQPYVSKVGVDSFEITLELSEPGVVSYAVAYAQMSGRFFSSYLLQYDTERLATATILEQSASSDRVVWKEEGVVAADSVVISSTRARIQVRPKCLIQACSIAENVNGSALSPATRYRVYLLAQDMLGNQQAQQASACGEYSPFVLDVETLEDLTPPQPIAKAVDVEESLFTLVYTQDEPGIAYYVLMFLPDEQELLQDMMGLKTTRIGSLDPLRRELPKRRLASLSTANASWHEESTNGPRGTLRRNLAQSALPSGGIAWAPCECCRDPPVKCSREPLDVMDPALQQIDAGIIQYWGCLSVPAAGAESRLPYNSATRRRALFSLGDGLDAPSNVTSNVLISDTAPSPALNGTVQPITIDKTFRPEPGQVLTYLVLTSDQWNGPSGPNAMEEPVAVHVRLADDSPPHLRPRIVMVSITSARIAFQMNERGSVYYMVLEAALNIRPGVEDVFARSLPPNIQANASAANVTDITRAWTEFDERVTGLEGLTNYTLWAAGEDVHGNRMTELVSRNFTTLDNQPPDLDAEITEVRASTAQFSVSLDESGTVYYVLRNASTPCPEPAALKREATISDSKNDGEILIKDPAQPKSEGLGTLLDLTDYALCLVAEDECCFNMQQSTTRLPFRTLDGTPPTVTISDVTATSLGTGYDSSCAVQATLTISEPGSGSWTLVHASFNISTAPVHQLLTMRPAARTALANATIVTDGNPRPFGPLTASNLSKTETFLSLPCDTDMLVVAAARDVAGNVMPEAVWAPISTPDVVPPRFVLRTPAAVYVTEQSAVLEVALDEAGSVRFEVLNGTVECPAPDLVAMDRPNATARLYQVLDKQVPRPDDPVRHPLTNLQEFSPYTGCFIAKDLANNTQTIVTVLHFSTSDASPPVLDARVLLGSIEYDQTTGRCAFTLQFRVSEPATVSFLVARRTPDLGEDSVTLRNLFPAPPISDLLPELQADQGQVVFNVSEEGSWKDDPVDKIDCDTDFLVWAAAEDVSGNRSKLKVLAVTTPDVVPPRFVNETPYAAGVTGGIGAVTDIVSVALDEEGRASCVVEECIESYGGVCATEQLPRVSEVLSGGGPQHVGNSSVPITSSYTPFNLSLSYTREAPFTYRACCAGIDRADNAMVAAECVSLEVPDTTPPVILRLTPSCIGSSRLKITFVVSEPSTVTYVVMSTASAAAPAVGNVTAAALFEGRLPGVAQIDIAASGSVVVRAAGEETMAGLCGIASSNIYAIYAVAHDLVTPPNESAVSRAVANMTQLCDSGAPGTCDPAAFLRLVQPRLRVISGPGFLSGQPVIRSSATGVSVHQSMALLGLEPPGTVTRMRISVGTTPARDLNATSLSTSGPSEATLSMRPQPIKHVRIVVRRQQLYDEEPTIAQPSQNPQGRLLSIVYTVLDADSRPQVSTRDLQIYPVILETGTRVRLPVDDRCTAAGLDPSTGVGNCVLELPSARMPAPGEGVATVSIALEMVVGGTVVAVSPSRSVTVTPKPAQQPLGMIGMYAHGPYRDLRPGESFAVSVYANAGTSSMDSFSFRLAYDTSVLTFEGFTQWPIFVESHNDTTEPGFVALLMKGQKPGVAKASFTGAAVALTDINFKVDRNATAGIKSGVLQIGSVTDPVFISSLVSNGDDISTQQSIAQISDRRGGKQTELQVRVLPVMVKALYAYAHRPELLSSEVITGQPVLARIGTGLVYNWHGMPDDTQVSGLACSTAPAAAARRVSVADGTCTVEISPTLSVNVSNLVITAQAQGFVSSVQIKLWQILNVGVRPHDQGSATLHRVVSPGTTPDSCSSTPYQTVLVSASASVTDQRQLFSAIDVSHIVSFTTDVRRFNVTSAGLVSALPTAGSDPAQVSVQKYISGSSTEILPLMVTTSETEECTVDLTPAAISSSTIAAASGFSLADLDVAYSRLNATVVQTFNAEGGHGAAFAYAQYADGSVEDVTADANIMSLAPETFTVSQSAPGLFDVVVGRLGAPPVCGYYLNATREICGVDVPPDGLGGIQVALPKPVAIEDFTASSHDITCPDDAAALAPVSVPTQAALVPLVRFSDGTVRRLDDDRAVFDVPAGDAVCRIVRATSGAARVLTTGLTCIAASCSVRVRYPALNATLSATVDLRVVVVTGVRMHPLRYDADAACPSTTPAAIDTVSATLRPVACSSGDFEQLTLCSLAQLSPGSNTPSGSYVDVTAAAVYATLTPQILALLPNLRSPDVSNRVRPLTMGTGAVNVTFGSAPGHTLAVNALGPASAVYVQSLNMSLPVDCTGLCGDTFSATQNTTLPLEATLTMSDGFVFSSTKLLGSDQHVDDVLNVSRVLGFASSRAQAIAVGQYGDITLLSNAPAAVTLTASTDCTSDGATLSDAVQAYANLQPHEMDVDIGEVYGTPLQQQSVTTVEPLQVGSTFLLAVRVNTAGSLLKAIDVEITFDESVLRAEPNSCTASDSGVLDEAGFECRVNIATLLDSIQVSYFYNGVDSRTGAQLDPVVTLCHVRLKVISPTPYSTIMTTIFGVKTIAKRVDEVVAVSGSMPFIAQAAGGRRLAANHHPLSHAVPAGVSHADPLFPQLAASSSSRALLQAQNQTYFDVTGDGVFNHKDHQKLSELSIAWTNTYESNAAPWLRRFPQVSDWQLQSTDPDFIYFSGNPATGLPVLPRPDNSTRPPYEQVLLEGSDSIDIQFYRQYIRPASHRAVKQMQRAFVRKQFFLTSFDASPAPTSSNHTRVSITLGTGLAAPLVASPATVRVVFEFRSAEGVGLTSLQAAAPSVGNDSASILSVQANFQASTGHFFADVTYDETTCSNVAELPPVDIAIATVTVDRQGNALNETFYPYYGSTQKALYLPTSVVTFQDTFRPYALISAAPPPVQIAPGFPTAANITPTAFTLQVLLDRAPDRVEYAVLDTASAESAKLLSANVTASNLFEVFDPASNRTDVLTSGVLGRVGPFAAADNGVETTDARKRWAVVNVPLDGKAGNVTAVLRVRSGCSSSYAVLSEILLPDEMPPTVQNFTVTSDCSNFDNATALATYKVTLEYDEPAEVWAVMYRNFTTWEPSTPLTPRIIVNSTSPALPELDIPQCNPTTSSPSGLLNAYKPCTPIARARGTTVTSAGVHAVSFTMLAAIRPNLTDLSTLAQRCAFTDVWGLSSSTVDLYVAARDTSETFRDREDKCGGAAGTTTASGVTMRSCSQATFSMVSSNNLQSVNNATLRYQRPVDDRCNSSELALPGLSNRQPTLVLLDATPRVTVNPSAYPSRMLRVQLGVDLPAAPEFTKPIEWVASESTSQSVMIRGTLDRPAYVFFATYQFEFDPRQGIEQLSSSVNPVAAGVVVAQDLKPTTKDYGFSVNITACDFPGWPPLRSSRMYFSILTSANAYGRSNDEIEAVVGGTT